jgi:predicted RNase H-like HicB family nuclease
MVIAWSDEDQVYIVRLPEFDNAKTHGSTYESAAKQGRTLIESFLIWHKQDGEPLPEPQVFVDSSDQERDVSLAGTH